VCVKTSKTMTDKRDNWIWIRDEHHTWLPAQSHIPDKLNILYPKPSAPQPSTPSIAASFKFDFSIDPINIDDEKQEQYEFKDVILTNLPSAIRDSIVPAMQSSIFSNVADLIKLEEFGEPAVLHVLRHRYSKGFIYSSIGDILLAINPFRTLPIYSIKVLELYKTSEDARRSQLPPHIYSVASASYWHMLTESKDQAIIISGESGAGKTGNKLTRCFCR
jgi:myosin heavy subunit